MVIAPADLDQTVGGELVAGHELVNERQAATVDRGIAR